jgi:hypothetical protein
MGPLALLKETRLNHVGKMAFRWMYWNMLLPGMDIPGVGARMSLRGKTRSHLPRLERQYVQGGAPEEDEQTADTRDGAFVA